MVHDKLLNFMAPQDNLSILEGKDQILLNLFNKIGTKQQKKEKLDVRLIWIN